MVIYELTERVYGIIAKCADARLESELIVMAASGMTRTEYTLSLREKADDAAVGKALAMAERRKIGEPLAYITGDTEFMGLTFKVTRDTLIPRSDTETLAETVTERIADRRVSVLDIGTGSGCIGISIARFCRNARVTLADVSAGALAAARENARANGVSVETLLCDVMRDVPTGKFDVIVSNPPYIKSGVIPTLQTEVRDYEPRGALDGGADGLMFYRRICEIAPKISVSGGLTAFEIGFDQAADVTAIMSGFENVTVIRDMCGNDRVITGELP